LTKAAENGESRYRRFRRWFPLAVFGVLLTFVLIEHSRPSSSELPVFEPAERVEFEPLAVPRGPLTLQGRVLASDGTPAPDVLVELAQEGEPHWCTTDDTGRFELEGLFPGRTEAVLVQLDTPPIRRRLTLPAEPVEWRLPARYSDLDGLPPVKRSALFGRLVSPLDARVDGCQLVLEPTEENPPLSAVVLRRVPVGSGGIFAVADLAVGHYRAYVVPPWADGGTWPRLVEREYEHTPQAEDLELVLESGELEGRLVLGGEDAPVSGAQVLVWSAERPERLWEPRTSDESGRFRVEDLPPGNYVVQVRAGEADLREYVSVPPRRRVTVDFGPIELHE
jgi:protocatechuate 3,4-dioxygenase beta subunit